MPPIAAPAVQFRRALRALVVYRRRWLVPAVAGLVLAGGYAVFMPRPWLASQTLVVRNEAVNDADGPGRFRQENEMKTLQESVQEIVRSRDVLARALARVGPPAGRDAADWPSEDDIARLRENVAIGAPGGAEFGKTEVLRLCIEEVDQQRAIALVRAVCEEMQIGLRELRSAKAGGLVVELEGALQIAQQDLATATAQLAQIEQQVGGADLADLRMLDQTGSGDSDLRRKLTTVETELRDARVSQDASRELLVALHAAQDNPGHLLATPNRLLESQPALRRLKDGLVDAQLRTAQLLGTMTSDHPQVRAAHAAEAEIGEHLHEELEIAIRGVEVEQRLAAGRIALLAEQRDDTVARLDRLAGLRADYSNVSAAVEHRTSLVELAEHDLAEARASQAAANSGSLVAVIGEPSTGPYQIGPRRLLVAASGLLAGLLAGLGIVYLTVPAGELGLAAAAPVAVADRNGCADAADRDLHVLSLNGALLKLAGRTPRAN
jgi:uncharacterized protein involved in exopolysaccharide biosynthesis